MLGRAAWVGLLCLTMGSLGLNLLLIKDPERAVRLREEMKQRLHQTEQARFQRELPELADYFSRQKFASANERIDFARQWIAANSNHDESYVVGDKPLDTTEMLKRLQAASQGKGDKPGLTCGPRALLLERILRVWGFRVRLVSIFFVNYSADEIGSHTYLEVLNPETERWEAVDPDNNLYYENSKGQRLSTLEIGAHPEQANPRRDSKSSGRKLLVDDYFRLPEAYKLVSIREIGGQSVVLLKDGFYDPGKVFKKNNCTLPDYFSGQNVIVY